jgi:hypothetical protein
MAPELTVERRPEGGGYLAKGSAGLTSKLSRLPTNAGSDSKACSWLVNSCHFARKGEPGK